MFDTESFLELLSVFKQFKNDEKLRAMVLREEDQQEDDDDDDDEFY